MKRAKRSRPPKAVRARSRKAPPRPPSTTPSKSPPKPPRPSAAETALLDLARALTSVAASAPSPRAAVTSALETLAAAFSAGAPLPRALAQARGAPRRDDAQTLAITWAREQLRLSLGEILDGAAAAGDVLPALPADALAWLVLAACEALAGEPREAAPDRLKLLAEWLTGPPRG